VRRVAASPIRAPGPSKTTHSRARTHPAWNAALSAAVEDVDAANAGLPLGARSDAPGLGPKSYFPRRRA